jgi:hypothetical protein
MSAARACSGFAVPGAPAKAGVQTGPCEGRGRQPGPHGYRPSPEPCVLRRQASAAAAMTGLPLKRQPGSGPLPSQGHYALASDGVDAMLRHVAQAGGLPFLAPRRSPRRRIDAIGLFGARRRVRAAGVRVARGGGWRVAAARVGRRRRFPGRLADRAEPQVSPAPVHAWRQSLGHRHGPGSASAGGVAGSGQQKAPAARPRLFVLQGRPALPPNLHVFRKVRPA